jgi:hypothetical protein
MDFLEERIDVEKKLQSAKEKLFYLERSKKLLSLMILLFKKLEEKGKAPLKTETGSTVADGTPQNILPQIRDRISKCLLDLEEKVTTTEDTKSIQQQQANNKLSKIQPKEQIIHLGYFALFCTLAVSLFLFILSLYKPPRWAFIS